jgi:CII-binding regulator of phage lambda lysogenization HflD
MENVTNEKLFYESLEQLSTEYKQQITNTLKNTNQEYKTLREKFGQILDRIESQAETMDEKDKELIDKFIEVYFALVSMEVTQIYLQGQVDGMRIMKKLYGDKIC